MALLTTIPASEMMPIMVIRTTKSILKIKSPNKTPIKLRNTDMEMIIGGCCRIKLCNQNQEN